MIAKLERTQNKDQTPKNKKTMESTLNNINEQTTVERAAAVAAGEWEDLINFTCQISTLDCIVVKTKN